MNITHLSVCKEVLQGVYVRVIASKSIVQWIHARRKHKNPMSMNVTHLSVCKEVLKGVYVQVIAIKSIVRWIHAYDPI